MMQKMDREFERTKLNAKELEERVQKLEEAVPSINNTIETHQIKIDEILEKINRMDECLDKDRSDIVTHDRDIKGHFDLLRDL